jgi:copper chaperone CopZ
VVITGCLGHVYVSTVEEALPRIAGPTRIEVHVPEKVPYQVLTVDDGFGYGYDVTFRPTKKMQAKGSSVMVEVWVVVPTIDTADTYPVLVELVPGSTNVNVSSATGRVNLTAHLKGNI